MAFNINAHIILQGPKNIKAVTNSIKQQLQGISVPVNLQTGQVSSATRQINTLNKGMQGLQTSAAATSSSLGNVNKASTKVATTLNKSGAAAKGMGKNLQGVANQAGLAAGAMHTLGRETALTFKRFAAAGIVTATVFRLGGAITEATGSALEFEREMVRLQQITGKTKGQLSGLKKSIVDVSKSLGISANDLSGIAKLFAQTGQSLKEVEASMKAIARSSLAPTFGEMEQTAEGLVAALNQFGISANQAEQVLGSLNRVSKKFAVESQDLIAAIRRAGGVFALASGQFKEPIQALKEFSAIFTAVRSTTRESAETIATGLRTIFTRIQRRSTIDMLKGLGISLLDTQGKFIGLFESFKKLSTGLDQLVQKGDAVTLSAITEELGGMRQVGKLLPAIREFKKAEKALKEATKGAAEGLGQDVAKGLTPLIKQFEILGSRFDDFIRKISESSTFKQLAGFAIDTANAFLSLGEALTPILPLLTQLAAMKLAKGAFSFGQGFFSSTKGMGAQGAGARAGSLVSGSGGGAAGAKQSTMTNTGALGKNTSALSVLSSSLKPLSSLSGDFTKLNTAMYALKDEIRRLAAISRVRPPSASYYGGGSSGGTRRGRVGLSGGGRVPSRGGSRVRFKTPSVPRVPQSPNLMSNRLYPNYRQTGTELLSSKSGGRTGMKKTVVNIKKGVSPQARSSTTFGAISMLDALGSGIGGQDVKGGANPLKAFYSTIKFGSYGPDAEGKPRPGLGINTPSKALIAEAGSRVAGSYRQGRGTPSSDTATIQIYTDTLNKKIGEKFEEDISAGLSATTNNAAKSLYKLVKLPPMASNLDPKKADINFETISGNLFELALMDVGSSFTKGKGKSNAIFDYPKGIGGLTKAFPAHGGKLGKIPTDVKRSINMDSILSMIKKGKNSLQDRESFFLDPTGYKAKQSDAAKKRALRAKAKFAGQTRPPSMKLTAAARGLQKSQVNDPDYWTDDGNLKAILMPGELVSYNANPAIARQISAGNVGAVRSLNKRNTSVVPGSGNRDTFPMDLPPGTVVVPKGLSQEAMAGGYEPRKPLSAGGTVGRGRVKMADGSRGAVKPFYGPGGAPEKLNANFGQLADSAVGVAFALQTLDFSTLTGMLTSFSQLGFLLPSILKSFQELPLAIAAAKTSFAGAAPLTQAAVGAGVALGAALISEKLVKKGTGQFFSGKITKGRVEGVEGFANKGKDLGLKALLDGSIGAALAAFATQLVLVNVLGMDKAKAGVFALASAAFVVAREISSYGVNIAKQAEFAAMEKFGKQVDKATKSLEFFIKSQVVTAKGLERVNKDVGAGLDITDQFAQSVLASQQAQASQNTGTGAAAGAIAGGKAGAAIGAALTSPTGPFAATGALIGGIIGTITGAISGYAIESGLFQGGAEDKQVASLKAGTNLLAVVTDKFIENINAAFDKITDNFISSLSSTDPTLQKLASITTGLDPTIASSNASFELLQRTLSETGREGKAFASFLDNKLRAGIVESLKSSSDAVKSVFAAASAQGIDYTDIDALASNQEQLAAATGLTTAEVALATSAMEAYKQTAQENIVNTINQRAKLEELNRILKAVTKSLDLFVASFELLATMSSQSAARFGVFKDELTDFVGYMTGGGGRIMLPGRSAINPFANVETSSEAALQGGINKIGVATGANTKGLLDAIKIRNIIPELGSAVAERAGENTQISTFEQLRDIMSQTLQEDFNIDMSQLPDAVKTALEAGLRGTVKGREGGSVEQLIGGQGYEDLIKQFGEASDQIRAALEKSYQALMDAQKNLLEIINQEIALEKFRIDKYAKANSILEATNKSLDKFRESTDYVSDANERLIKRLQAIDGGQGNITLSAAQQQATLQGVRQRSATLRQAITASGGPALGADASSDDISTFMAGQGSLFDAATMELVNQLRINEKAITRETKKLDELINETERLEAVNQTLTDVQKAQLDAEGQARYFISGLARAEGETDPRRRGKILADLMQPFTAWSKALAGGTLNMREFASLVENFDSRIRPILRSQGMSEADIATAKRGFFARFSKDFPAIFTSAIAQSTVSIKGPIDLALDQIATSMSTAGKKITEILGTDFPGLLADAFANTDLGLEASVGDLMNKMNALAEEKSQALLKDTTDIITPIKDAIELNVIALNETGLSEALKSMTDPAEIAAGAVAEFGNNLSNLISSGGELDLFVTALSNAGERINKLLEKSQAAADEGATVAEQERIVAHENIIEKPRERFKNVDEVKKAVTKEIQEYRAGTDSSATVLRQLAQTLADQGKIDLTVDSDPTGIFEALGEGPSIRNKTPEELFNDIFGDSMGAPFAFADWNNWGEESGILDAANVGRGGQSTTDFMKIDQSKFDEGIASYGAAMTESLNKLTNAGLNAKFEREFGGEDAVSKARRQSVGLGDDAISYNAGNAAERSSMIEALQKLAVDRETKQNSVSSLYDELIGLGKRDEAKALLKTLDEAGRIDVKMASDASASRGFLQNIDSNIANMRGGGEEITGARGGFLRGPSHNMGGMLAELEGGEYVLSKNAVKRLGRGNLDALNSGSLSMRTPQIAYGEDGGLAGGVVDPRVIHRNRLGLTPEQKKKEEDIRIANLIAERYANTLKAAEQNKANQRLRQNMGSGAPAGTEGPAGLEDVIGSIGNMIGGYFSSMAPKQAPKPVQNIQRTRSNNYGMAQEDPGGKDLLGSLMDSIDKGNEQAAKNAANRPAPIEKPSYLKTAGEYEKEQADALNKILDARSPQQVAIDEINRKKDMSYKERAAEGLGVFQPIMDGLSVFENLGRLALDTYRGTGATRLTPTPTSESPFQQSLRKVARDQGMEKDEMFPRSPDKESGFYLDNLFNPDARQDELDLAAAHPDTFGATQQPVGEVADFFSTLIPDLLTAFIPAGLAGKALKAGKAGVKKVASKVDDVVSGFKKFGDELAGATDNLPYASPDLTPDEINEMLAALDKRPMTQQGRGQKPGRQNVPGDTEMTRSEIDALAGQQLEELGDAAARARRGDAAGEVALDTTRGAHTSRATSEFGTRGDQSFVSAAQRAEGLKTTGWKLHANLAEDPEVAAKVKKLMDDQGLEYKLRTPQKDPALRSSGVGGDDWHDGKALTVYGKRNPDGSIQAMGKDAADTMAVKLQNDLKELLGEDLLPSNKQLIKEADRANMGGTADISGRFVMGDSYGHKQLGDPGFTAKDLKNRDQKWFPDGGREGVPVLYDDVVGSNALTPDARNYQEYSDMLAKQYGEYFTGKGGLTTTPRSPKTSYTKWGDRLEDTSIIDSQVVLDKSLNESLDKFGLTRKDLPELETKFGAPQPLDSTGKPKSLIAGFDPITNQISTYEGKAVGKSAIDHESTHFIDKLIKEQGKSKRAFGDMKSDLVGGGQLASQDPFSEIGSMIPALLEEELASGALSGMNLKGIEEALGRSLSVDDIRWGARSRRASIKTQSGGLAHNLGDPNKSQKDFMDALNYYMNPEEILARAVQRGGEEGKQVAAAMGSVYKQSPDAGDAIQKIINRKAGAKQRTPAIPEGAVLPDNLRGPQPVNVVDTAYPPAPAHIQPRARVSSRVETTEPLPQPFTPQRTRTGPSGRLLEDPTFKPAVLPGSKAAGSTRGGLPAGKLTKPEQVGLIAEQALKKIGIENRLQAGIAAAAVAATAAVTAVVLNPPESADIPRAEIDKLEEEVKPTPSTPPRRKPDLSPLPSVPPLTPAELEIETPPTPTPTPTPPGTPPGTLPGTPPGGILGSIVGALGGGAAGVANDIANVVTQGIKEITSFKDAKPFVSTARRGADGELTGFGAERSTSRGVGPLVSGNEKRDRKRYETMKRNRDKFAKQMEGPNFDKLVDRDPTSYAARIKSQKEALDKNLGEFDKIYEFDKKKTPAQNAAAQAAAQAAAVAGGGKGNLETIKDENEKKRLEEIMGIVPKDKKGASGNSIRDLIDFLKTTCLKVEPCGGGGGGLGVGGAGGVRGNFGGLGSGTGARQTPPPGFMNPPGGGGGTSAYVEYLMGWHGKPLDKPMSEEEFNAQQAGAGGDFGGLGGGGDQFPLGNPGGRFDYSPAVQSMIDAADAENAAAGGGDIDFLSSLGGSATGGAGADMRPYVQQAINAIGGGGAPAQKKPTEKRYRAGIPGRPKSMGGQGKSRTFNQLSGAAQQSMREGRSYVREEGSMGQYRNPTSGKIFDFDELSAAARRSIINGTSKLVKVSGGAAAQAQVNKDIKPSDTGNFGGLGPGTGARQTPPAGSYSGGVPTPEEAAAMMAQSGGLTQAQMDTIRTGGGSASNTQLAGNMGVTPTAGEAVGTLAGPLISDETVNRLVEFGSMFAADGPVHQIFNGFVGRLENVVGSISKIPSSIELTLQTPRVEVIVNANNISERIGAVVQGMIFEAVAGKFDELSARVKNLENSNRPDGAGNSMRDV